jgi:uncharacterized protein with FMN-binding domain
MKRTPVVVTATIAGLAGVLAFHTTPSRLSLGTLPGASSSSPAPATAGPSGSGQGRSAGGSSSPPKPGSAASAQAGGTRTVDGPAVNYNFGVLSVSVTVSGHKMTKVGIASLNDGGMSRSQYIDQQAIPLLEQQAMQAQSANIQGVSGASYTSAGFEQSLQAALHSLGLQ